MLASVSRVYGEEVEGDTEHTRSFAFDFMKGDGTEERWILDVHGEPGDRRRHRTVHFYRNGISQGYGLVGYRREAANASGNLWNAVPVVHAADNQYRVSAQDERWFLDQLQMAGAIESRASMQERMLEKLLETRARARRGRARFGYTPPGRRS